MDKFWNLIDITIESNERRFLKEFKEKKFRNKLNRAQIEKEDVNYVIQKFHDLQNDIDIIQFYRFSTFFLTSPITVKIYLRCNSISQAYVRLANIFLKSTFKI